jgi:hypothetical protein
MQQKIQTQDTRIKIKLTGKNLNKCTKSKRFSALGCCINIYCTRENVTNFWEG